MPAAIPEESIAAAQDAAPQKPLVETAEESTQPVIEEAQVSVPEESVAAAQDVAPQKPLVETAEESTQPVIEEAQVSVPEESVAAAQDTPSQEHLDEIAEENPQPVAAETPEAFPQYSFDASQDAVPQEHFGKIAEENTQPVSAEMQAADQQEHSDTALGAEQLDYLTKLDAQHQEYMASLEAAKRPSTDAVAEQPEPTGPLPPPAATLPALEPPASGEPIAPIEVLPPITPIPPVKQPGLTSNAAVTIVVIGIILGVLFGGVIAAITWKATKQTAPPAPVGATPGPNLPRDTRDLGSVDSSAVGLSGHLTTKWDGKLDYTLAITPDDPARAAVFALMAGDPPRPLSMNIELKNSYGFILCSREAVLKYDAAKASADWKLLGNTSAPPAVDEAAREKDKDVFQNQTGADGKLASIRAQGEIPCPAEAYANFAYWSFTPNYPDITEQDQLLQDKLNAAAPAPRKRTGRKRSRTARTH
jgi:chemotaxis protein histidine kinase CheA